MFLIPEDLQKGTRDLPIQVTDPDELSYWTETAPPGEWVHYWTGHLARARDLSDEERQITARRADNLARIARGAYNAGDVILVQRRFAGTTLYLAVKTGLIWKNRVIPRGARGGGGHRSPTH